MGKDRALLAGHSGLSRDSGGNDKSPIPLRGNEAPLCAL